MGNTEMRQGRESSQSGVQFMSSFPLRAAGTPAMGPSENTPQSRPTAEAREPWHLCAIVKPKEGCSLQCHCLVLSSQALGQGVAGATEKRPPLHQPAREGTVSATGCAPGVSCVHPRCNQKEIQLSFCPMTPMGSHEPYSETAVVAEGESELGREMHRIRRCRKGGNSKQERKSFGGGVVFLLIFIVLFHYHLLRFYPTPTITHRCPCP